MLLLCTTGSVLKLVTGGAQAVSVQASWVDVSGSTVTPGALNTAISSATTTTVVGAPGVSTQRNIKAVAIRNTDGSTADTITVQHYDGTTTVVLLSFSLAAGHTLFYEDGRGWYSIDNLGSLVSGITGATGANGSNGTNGTNGTNAGNIGYATIDFGAAPGTNTASVVVTGQSSILTSSAAQAFLMADSTVSGAAGHNAEEHKLLASEISLSCGNIVAGTGFTIYAETTMRLSSTIKTRFVWN